MEGDLGFDIPLLDQDREEIEEIIDFAIDYEDVFSPDYIGHWACGIKFEKGRGWLFRLDELDGSADDAAKSAWASGEALPEGYYSLDRLASLCLVKAGITKYGLEGFLYNWDANSFDAAAQIYFLKEVVYG